MNLNGHTVTCNARDTGPNAKDAWGIVVPDSTVKKRHGARLRKRGHRQAAGLVEGMTLDGNGAGVMLRENTGGRPNVIMGNPAMDGASSIG